MSNTSLYKSKVEIPKEWLEKIESYPDRDERLLVFEQRREFIKKFHKTKTKKDIADVLGLNERTVRKILSKMKKKGEI